MRGTGRMKMNDKPVSIPAGKVTILLTLVELDALHRFVETAMSTVRAAKLA